MNYTRKFTSGEVLFASRQSLVANTVLTYYPGQCASVEIQNLSATDDIYFSINGTNPTVDGPKTLLIPAGTAIVVPFRAEIKLISTGAPKLQFVGVV